MPSTDGGMSFVLPERFRQEHYLQYVDGFIDRVRDCDVFDIERCLNGVLETIAFGNRRLVLMCQLAELLKTGMQSVNRFAGDDGRLDVLAADHQIAMMQRLPAFSAYVAEEGEGGQGNCSRSLALPKKEWAP